MNPKAGVLGCVLLAFAVARAEERFPFVIPGDDASPSITDMSGLSPHAAGADGFVRIKDGHFFTDAGRLRIWGVNTTFGANFPEHADAEKVAAHLAKLGINGVRVHHHDSAPAPRGLWDPVTNGHRPLNAAQLEKQDYFLDQLNRHGVYINLNLHVGRDVTDAEGFPTKGLPYSTRYDKYLLYFEPVLRDKLKEFCREYLLHENPYRHLRRVDDPGIAMVEITNENSFSKLGTEIAAELPEPHRGEFKRQWNTWLANHYPTTEALRKAWGGANEPLGPVLADSTAWKSSSGVWRTKQSSEYPLRLSFGRPGPQPDAPAVLIEPQRNGPELSANELQRPNLVLKPGQIYTLSFWVRGSAPRPLFIDVSNAGPGNWNPVGFKETLQLKTEWQHIHRVFRAAAEIPGQARICFKFGGAPVAFELAGLTLRQGGDWIVVPAGQSIEARSVEIPVNGWSEAAQRDARRFMADTEQGFIADMMSFLKKDLGVKVPITASQITYHSPAIVAATCDYTDIHAYWQHPRFPRKPWDPIDWNIANTPMERAPDADAFLNRAPWRLLDRPCTMSEWNIPEPNDYAASVAPFAALIAGVQDWDGIFFFQYQSGGENGWYSDRVQRFFSFNGQPAKLALLTACANLYRRGDLAPLPKVAAGTLDQMVPATAGFSARIGIDPKAKETASVSVENPKRLAEPTGSAVWDATNPKQAHVVVNTPATRGVWGLVGGQTFTLGSLNVAVGQVERDYAAILLTSTDAQPLETTKRILLVAVGSAANGGMKWNAARNSVGNQWGTGPAEVNGVPLTLELPRAGAHIWALDGRGQRKAEVAPVAANRRTFELSGKYQTLWYEVSW